MRFCITTTASSTVVCGYKFVLFVTKGQAKDLEKDTDKRKNVLAATFC
jgi:hypothetical protein